MKQYQAGSAHALELGAQHLIRARRNMLKLDELPESCRPHSLDEGYVMQRAATMAWPDTIAGWKVGATAASVQKMFGVSEPIYGPVFTKSVFPSPACLRTSDFQHLLLEAELAFVFGKQLLPTRQPRPRDEILDAIASVIPAFEIVSPRFKALPSDRLPQLVADFGANGGAVLGHASTDWRSMDFSTQHVTLSTNGRVRQRGTGALALGDPLNVLNWLVKTFSEHAIAIEAGQFVLTGTLTGIYTAQIDETCVADFENLGSIEVVFE